MPFEIPQRRGNPKIVDTDEPPRPDTTIEGLAKLKPVFKKDGTVTAGNASGMNNGAAGVLLMNSEEAEQLGVAPLRR